MKKKLLTVALAATMVVGSVFNAFAATISGAWWTAWTEGYEIKDGTTTEFSIDVKGGADIWSNVATVFASGKTTGTQDPNEDGKAIDGYKEYALIRGDNHGWSGSGDNKSASGGAITYAGGIADLGNDDFIATMKDCHIDAKITRSGNDMTVVFEGKGTNGKTFTRTASFSEDMSVGVWVFFVADGSEVTVEKKAGETTPAPVTPEPTTPEDKKPAPPTGDATTSMITLLAVAAVGASLVVFVSKKNKVTE